MVYILTYESRVQCHMLEIRAQQRMILSMVECVCDCVYVYTCSIHVVFIIKIVAIMSIYYINVI